MLCLFHFVEGDDEGKHDSDIAVHRCPEQRAELRLEQLWLVQAHSDRAPAEEGIWIGRIATDRQLVASDIKRANHHRPSAKRLDYVSISPILLLLVGHRSAAHDKELGAHQAHTFSTAASGEFSFLRQVDVCPQRYPVTVQGN